MPIPSGGSPIGDRPGGSPRDSLRQEQAARDARVKSMIEEAKRLQELIKWTQDQADATDDSTDHYKQLTEALDHLNERYEKTFVQTKKLLDERRRENTYLTEAAMRYRILSREAQGIATGAQSLVQGFHAYNLEIQRTIDLSGRFAGNSQRGRQQFDQLRKDLRLTQEEAVRFGQTWAQALRMGASTDQVTRAVSKLRGAFGHAGGQAAAATIAQIPLSGATFQGVLAGNAGAMERALRVANQDQAIALGGLNRGPGDALSQEAVRFQNQQAELVRIADDVRTAMAAGAAAGLGPELGALALPLTEINVKVGRLLDWALGSRAWLGSLLTGAAGAGLSGRALGVVGGAGAIRGLLRSGVGKLSLGGLAAAGIGLGADYLAGGMTPGGTGERVARGVGSLARVGGYALTGAAIGSFGGPVGTGIGAAIGAGVGAFTELPDQITGAIQKGFAQFGRLPRWLGGELTQRSANRENPVGALNTELAGLRESIQGGITGLAAELGGMPEEIRSQLSRSRMSTAIENIDPAQMFKIGTEAAQSFSAAINLASDNWIQQSNQVAKAMANVDAELRRGVIDQKEHDARIATLGSEMVRVAQSMDQVLGANPVRQAAAGAMQKMEARGGQIGQETEAVRLRYQRTGAITGNIKETNRLQQQINAAYEENVRLTEREGGSALEQLRANMDFLAARKGNAQLSDDQRESLQTEYNNVRNQFLQTQRQLNIRKENLQLENQNQNFELMRERALSAERGILFRRSQQNQALLRAQESFLRESGARPEEIGAVARQQSTEAGANLNRFMETFGDRMSELQQQLQAAPNEQARIQAEETIFALTNRRVELETQALEARRRAAGAEEQYRQEQIGANRRIAEINRDMSARLGQSWRVQMGYQSQIIQLQQEDLQSSRRELEGLAQALGGQARAMQDPGFLNKLADLAQKQAGLAEAIIGKQRNFLEQATAAGFGVGSGSRVSPVINPRIFGEMVQGFSGMRQPGEPMTVGQNRAMLRRGLGPQIFGGIPGGMGAVPGGVPGAVPGGVPEGVPGGVPGAFVGPPRPPGLGGPQAMAPVDVSGQIVVRVESNNPNVKAEVEKVAIQMSRPGAPV